MTVFYFKSYSFDDRSNRLFRGHEEVRLQPKTTQLLAHFLHHQGEILSKEHLLKELWKETTVSDHVLSQSLKKLRSALNDDREGAGLDGSGLDGSGLEGSRLGGGRLGGPRLDWPYIKTYPGQGYQWVCPLNPRVGTPKRSLFLLAAVFVLGLVGTFVFFGTRQPDAPKQRTSLAVADFRDLSPEPSQGWYGIAIAEILRAELADQTELRLVSGESTVWASQALNMAEIDSHAPETMQMLHETLGNDYWIGGSYLVERSRIQLNLIFQETEGGNVVFSVAKTGETSEFISLVSEVTSSVLNHLGGMGTPVQDSEISLEKALLTHPEVARSFMLGLGKLRKQEYKEAISYFETALEFDSESPLILSRLATAWLNLGYLKQAQSYSEKAMLKKDLLPLTERIMVQAIAHKTQHKWSKAADGYQTLRTLYPDDPEFGLLLAESRIREGSHDRAIDVLAEMRNAGHDHPDVRIDLMEARAARLQAKPEELIEASTRTIEQASKQGLNSVLAEAWLLHCEGQRRIGNLDKAFDAAITATALFEQIGDKNGYAEAQLQHGNTFMQTGQFSEAELLYQHVRELKQGLSQMNGLGSALNNLGAIAYHRGQLDKAQIFFTEAKKAFEVVGDKKRTANALINLGIIQASSNEYDQAFDYYQEAHVLYSSIGNIDGQYRVIHSMATLYHRKGDPVSALKYLERAVKLLRENKLNAELTRTLMNLGMIQKQLVDLENAHRNLEEACSLAIAQGQSRWAGEAQLHLAELLYLEGNIHQSEASALAAKAAYNQTKEAINIMLCDVFLARLAWERGQLDDQNWEELVCRFEPDSVQFIEALDLDIRLALERGQGNQAIQHARAALDLALAKNEKSQELICRQLYVESLMKAGRVPQAKQEFDTANAILLKANWPLLNLSYRITKARLDHLHGYSQKAQFDLETLVSELGLAGIWTYLLEAQLVRVQIARDLGQLEVAAGLQEWVGTCARDLGFSRQGKIALLGLSQP